MKKLIATLILIAGIAQAEHVVTIQITIPDRLEEDLESLLLTMPGHYGDKKKKTGTKKVSKGLAALAKKRPKVAAAIMKNKKKK